MKKNNSGNIVRGIILLIVGAVLVAFGFGFTVGNFRLYIGLEIAGAVCILAGMTPIVLYFQNRTGQDQTGTGAGAGYNGENNYGSGGRKSLHHANESVTADIVGVTRNLRGTAGDKVEYYVMCRYFNREGNTWETFTSRALPDYPGKDIIGRKVRVIFHSDDPGDYTVDLQSIS